MPQLLTGLNTLNSAINELARSYITHTNKLLGSAALPPALDPDSFPSAFSTLFASGGAGLLPGIAAAAAGAPSSITGHGAGAGAMGSLGAVDRKVRAARKPRRRVKDPNAPKRPLTAYFLFAMDERAKVKEMLPHAASHEVNNEILTRWKSMLDENKTVRPASLIQRPTNSRQVWRVRYEKSMEGYRAQMAAYNEQLARDASLNVDDDVVMDMAEVLSGADALAAAAGADHHVIDPSLDEGFDDVEDDEDDVLGDAHHQHHAHHNVHPHQMHQHHAQLHHDDLVALAPAPAPQAPTRKAAAPRKPRAPAASASAAHPLSQTVGSVSPSSQLVATAQQQQETAAAAVAAAVAQQQGKKDATKRKREPAGEGDGRRKQVRRTKEGAASGT